MADIRKLPFRVPPQLIPEEILDMTFTCNVCGLEQPISWYEPQPFPKQPVVPNSGEGYWIPVSIAQKCECGNVEQVLVPRGDIAGTWGVYGDEAERVFGLGELPGVSSMAHFFCITLVGLHRSGRAQFEKRLAKLKHRIRPDRAPETWRLHFTDIWGMPPGEGGFAIKGKDDKIKVGLELADLMRKSRPHLYTFNISGCRIHPEGEDWAKTVKLNKQEVFAAALLTSLEQFRRRKLSIRWNFDHAVNPEKRNGSEGWAEEVFLGLQYAPLFTWLSAGAPILSPIFHVPGSHGLLEIADVMSFFVARDFHQRAMGRNSEIPSSRTGLGYYCAFSANGGINSTWSRGLPIEQFYPALLVKA